MTLIALTILIIASAIVLHEYAHAWTANRLGDPTAKQLGRLTVNPIKHIDPIGSVILPGVLIFLRAQGYPVFPIGWAKPVPVNFRRLYNPKRDMIWVGIAGPIVNVVLAVIFSLFIRSDMPLETLQLLRFGIFINLLLAVFNMVPVPPLDGSRLVMGLLPNELARPYSRLEPYGILIVIGLVYLGLFEHIVWPVMVALGQMLGVNFNEIF